MSMHILDIAQNSIQAGAKRVCLSIQMQADGWLLFSAKDDGHGMPPELLAHAAEPFVTTGTARRVGLGLPLLKQSAERTGGSLTIESKMEQGTLVTARMDRRSMDCIPLGDVCASFLTLVMLNPQKPDFLLQATSPKGQACFDTRTARSVLGGRPLGPNDYGWVKESIDQAFKPILEV